MNLFELVDITADLASKALKGPTKDFEDNIQLHSAVVADADYFVTFDKTLLNMKFFGRMRIVLPNEFAKL